MRRILALFLFVLISATPSFAATWKISGSLSKVRDTCNMGDPSRMPLNQTLDCTYGYCIVRDKTNGIVMDGYLPSTKAVLDGTFGLNNGCVLTVGYIYQNPGRNKNVPMTELFILQCGSFTCSIRYDGNAKFK